MTMVWENFNRGGSEKLAMLALADWCDDYGNRLHPSISGVAKKINVSESQARRIIHKFIDEGFLTVTANHDGGNPGQTRHYRMNLEMLSTPSVHATPCSEDTPSTHDTSFVEETPGMDATPSADATPSMDARDPLHGCARPLAPMRETPSTHDTRTVINHHITVKEPLIPKTEEFDIFWNSYPNKTGKQDALKKWVKIKPSLQKILDALQWQKRSQQWQQGYIPNPATYLNQHRWEDEPRPNQLPRQTAKQQMVSVAAKSIFGPESNSEKCIEGEVIRHERLTS